MFSLIIKKKNIFKVINYLQKKFAELGSPNKLNVYMGHGAKAWVSDFNHPHYMAGRKAMKTGTSTGPQENNRNVIFKRLVHSNTTNKAESLED